MTREQRGGGGIFRNRREAGHKLSVALQEKQAEFDIVLAIPRGGVVVADEIAHDFQRPLDVVLAKKIGSPNLPDYAIGAVAPDGEILAHTRMVRKNDVDPAEIGILAAKVKEEINRQLDMYRSSKAPLEVTGKKVLLVDDGIATGFTIKAAIGYLRRMQASKVYITAPVCSVNAYYDIKENADDSLVLKVPRNFYAVGQFYEDFSEVDNKQVIYILKQY